MTPAELLNAAADLIEQRGLAKGTYEDDDGRLCAAGALRVACYGKSRPSKDFIVGSKYYAAMRLLRTGLTDSCSIADWSDRNDAATVIATLRAAAAGAE